MTSKELKNIAPKLHELKQLGSGFDVPKGYFETVEAAVLEKIATETVDIPDGYFDSIEDRVFEKLNNKTKVISLKTTILKKIVPTAIAASILLFVTLQLFNSVDEDVFAQIEATEIEHWIENGNLEFDSFEIASIYDEIDFEGLELSNIYDETDLIEYLDGIDLESHILTN